MADPKESRALAEYLHEWLSVDILGLRLPGHGSTYEDLLLTNKEDWQLAVTEAYAFMQEQYQKNAIIGVSMGALLSLEVAAKTSPEALVMVGVPFYLTDLRIGKLATLCKWVPWLKKGIGAKSVATTPEPERKDYIYANVCLGSILELTQVIAEKRAFLKEIACPLLLCHSREDAVANVSAVEMVLKETQAISEDDKKAVVTNGPHSLFFDLSQTPKEALEELVLFLQIHLNNKT